MVVITDEQEEAWARGRLCAAVVDMDGLMKVVREIAEAAVIAYMEFEKAMDKIASIVWAGLAETANELEEFEAIEEGTAILDKPDAWNWKEGLEKQRAIEQTNAARFRQYKAGESARAARKRTGQRRREWRGPWKEN